MRQPVTNFCTLRKCAALFPQVAICGRVLRVQKCVTNLVRERNLSSANHRKISLVTSPSNHIITRIGGPAGRFALPHRWWSPLRVIILMGLFTFSMAYLAKANCLHGVLVNGVAQLDWSGNRQYTSACYNDIVPLYKARGLDQGGFPYAYSWSEDGRTRYMEYPVLAGMFQWFMAMATHVVYPVVSGFAPVVPQASVYFTITAVVLAVVWLLVLRMLVVLAGRRQWDAMVVAVSPLVVAHGLTNWDVASIAFAVGALWAWSRGRPGLAGALIGAGAAFKLWPLFLLGAYLVLAVRSGALRVWLRAVGASIVVWLVVNLPVALVFPQAWGEFLRLNSERGWEWTTVYAVMSRELGWSLPVDVLNGVSLGLFVVACVGIALFGLCVRRRPRVAELAFLIVAAFLLVNKVWSPQYSLWLVPLAVLALPCWRLVLWWGLIDALTWPVLTWHMMGSDAKGAPAGLLDLFVVGRDVAIICIAVLIMRQMLGKNEDKVRRDNDGCDPLSGSLGDHDVWVSPRRIGTVN
ncbi:hypothetical protein CIP107527_02361 [Corynebacterium diphtheriae]|nr:hypothetical protein CIP107527_02361 [Corynebacterium diphtheriae]